MNDKCRLIVGFLALVLAGCASTPIASFNSYLQNFSVVKGSADDLYLRAGNIAEEIANRPEAEGTVTERLNLLDSRRAALNVRLAALTAIDRYNRTLVSLASGQSPDALQSDITGLQQDLSSLNIGAITKLVGAATPFVGVVSQGIALIENEVKKKKFADAVVKAQKPMEGIVDILLLDADSLQELMVQEIQLNQDPYFKQIGSYSARFNRRLKEMKATPEIEALLVRVNKARQLTGNEGMSPLTKPESTDLAVPTPTDIDALMALIGQVELAAASHKKLSDQIEVEKSVFKEYKSALNATKETFANLQDALNTGRVAATLDFVNQARALRKATLKLKEAL